MLKIGPKGTCWELVSVVAYCPIIALSSGSYGGYRLKGKPLAHSRCYERGADAKWIRLRDAGGLLGLELRLDEELLDADERTLGDLA